MSAAHALTETPSTAVLAASRRDEFAALLRLALPLAGANLVQMGVFASDTMFIARLGPHALAAASLATGMMGLLVWSGSGLIALAPLVAAELGRRNHAVREVRRTTRMALWIALALGVVLGLALQFSAPFLTATGQAPDLVRTSSRFVALLGLVALPMMIAGALRAFVSALDRAVYATWINLLALAANVLGNWLLVFGHGPFPALGLAGSAIASLCTGWTMVFAYVVVIARDRRLRRYHIWGRFWRPEWRRLREILALGLPTALTILGEAGLFSGAGLLIGRIDEVQLAGHAVALQVAALMFQVPAAVGQAATIRVGYAFGARDHAAAGRAGSTAILAGLGFSVASALLLLLLPRPIVGVYVVLSDPANAAAIRYAVSFLAVASAFQLVDGIQTIASGALRGLQDARVPMVIALVGYWVPGLGTAIALGFYTPLQGLGVWVGLAVGLLVVASLMCRRWMRRERLGLVA